MRNLTDKTILITGAATGMGHLFAELALADGARVVLWDINLPGLKKSVQALVSRAEYRERVFLYKVDISIPASIKRAARTCIKDAGLPDVIFNNAGIVVGKFFHEHSTTEIDTSIGVNLSGVMHVTNAFLPAMLEEKSEAHIVNLASAAGLIPTPQMSVYAATKWGVIGWSESLRLELRQLGRKKFHITTVQPSYIKTGMFDGVHAPWLVPLLDPEKLARQIWQAFKKNKPRLRAPLFVKFIPLFKGVLPQAVFDRVADVLGVYHSMDDFKGHHK